MATVTVLQRGDIYSFGSIPGKLLNQEPCPLRPLCLGYNVIAVGTSLGPRSINADKPDVLKVFERLANLLPRNSGPGADGVKRRVCRLRKTAQMHKDSKLKWIQG
jgi:hypothetical protein